MNQILEQLEQQNQQNEAKVQEFSRIIEQAKQSGTLRAIRQQLKQQ
jgi:hypothetical protein